MLFHLLLVRFQSIWSCLNLLPLSVNAFTRSLILESPRFTFKSPAHVHSHCRLLHMLCYSFFNKKTLLTAEAIHNLFIYFSIISIRKVHEIRIHLSPERCHIQVHLESLFQYYMERAQRALVEKLFFARTALWYIAIKQYLLYLITFHILFSVQ